MHERHAGPAAEATECVEDEQKDADLNRIPVERRVLQEEHERTFLTLLHEHVDLQQAYVRYDQSGEFRVTNCYYFEHTV